MADLLTNEDKNSFKESILDLFDTFSREIRIHKAPKKIINQTNVNVMPGYNESSVEENIQLIPRSSTFKAMIDYGAKQSIKTEKEAGINIPLGTVSVKVKQDARDYILDGTTERVEIDGRSFHVTTKDSVKYYFGLKLYVFYVQEVS